MRKIKDKHTLGVISGIVGGIVMLAADHISKRIYTDASAGTWVGEKRQAQSKTGTVLGISMSLISSMFGSLLMTEMISKRGKDNINTKGFFYGTAYGGIISVIQSALPKNKLRPKDSSSNLSYLVCNALYGLVTANSIARLGDESIFPKAATNTELSTDPLNNYYFQPQVRPETQESYFQAKRHYLKVN
ncbi:MAG: hypothetical protein APF84_06045 [Gracilibacter sp. BRH_c7a]|nr:MAG: hypothetical protein APF84_06045 [Gracilibacter sp. BRH_c7a]